MNLQIPPDRPAPSRSPAPSQRRFWPQIFPELALTWGGGLLIGGRIVANLALPEALGAISLAGLVALSNGWGRGQLALRLRSGQAAWMPWQQFTADLLLGLAKLTAAAAFLLKLARYGLSLSPQIDLGWLLPLALLALLGIAMLVARLGIRFGAGLLWILPVGLTLLGLGGAIVIELSGLPRAELVQLGQTASLDWTSLLRGAALLSVAYASYEPLSLPPRITSTQSLRLTLKTFSLGLGLGWLLFGGVAILANSSVVSVLVSAVSITGQASALLKTITLGAMAILTGLLLLLLPQLTRQLIHLRQAVHPLEISRSPLLALISISLILAAMLLVGEIESFWAFSAFAGLMHAALVQWTLLRSSSLWPMRWDRRLSQGQLWLRECFQGLRLVACLLGFWVEWQVWLVSLALIGLGLIWRGMMQWTDEQVDE